MAFRPRVGYLYIVPALIIVAAVGLYPILYEVWISLTDWYPLRSLVPVFYGFRGYERLIADPVFWQSIGRTIVWTAGTVLLEYLLALPLALLLNRPSRLNGILSGLVLLPWVAPSVVIAYTWRWLLDGQSGTLHYLMRTLGIVGERSLLSDVHYVLPALILVSAWKGIPFMVVALLAALKTIPVDLYEAAAVDGASGMDRFRFITLPLLRRVSVVMSLVLGILAFYSFDIVWIMTKGGPSDASMLIGIYLFRNFFERQELSYSATMGILMLLILLVFSVVYLRLLTREEEQ